MIYYYFSKWRNEWIEFSQQPPTKGQLLQMKKFNYKVKTN
jgi:hypothetical protein